MTAHEHHTHPYQSAHDTSPPERYCCCGWGYPDPIRSGESVDGLPTWEQINARDPQRHPAAHSTRCWVGCVCPVNCVPLAGRP